MKNILTSLAIAFAFTLCSSAQAGIIVIGESVGNGDFQAPTTYTGSTATFGTTPGWVNLGGADINPSFGANNQLNNSPDPVHLPDNSNNQGAFLSVGNEAANTSGYTVVEAGQVFTGSLFYNASGGTAGYGDADPNAPGNGNLDDESINIFLFTNPTAVDDTTDVANIMRLANTSVDIDRLDNGTITGLTYTTSAVDIGSTVYFGVELINPTTGNPFPRVDLATLEVTPPATIPEPSSIAVLGLIGLAGVLRRKRS